MPPPPKQYNPLLIGTVIGVVLCLGAFLYVLYTADYSHGDLVRPHNPNMQETDNMKGIRTEVDHMSDSFSYIITIISSAFAFIAFLVTFQSQRGMVLSSKAWGWLCTGIIVLVGGLVLCLFGKELLINMSVVNSVDLSLPALSFSRIANYYCLIIAAVCIGFFAMEIATGSSTPAKQIPPNHDDD